MVDKANQLVCMHHVKIKGLAAMLHALRYGLDFELGHATTTVVLPCLAASSCIMQHLLASL